MRPRAALAAAAAGAAAGAGFAPHPWACAAALAAGAGALALRRVRAGALGLALVAFAAAGYSAWLRARPIPVEELARSAAGCSVRVRVLERSGGLGSLVAVESARCGGAAYRDAGPVLARTAAPPGAELEGRGHLLPLAGGGLGRAQRAAGARAVLELASAEVVNGPRGLFGAAAALRASLRRAASGLGERPGALLQGLAVGDGGGLPAKLEEDLRRAGLAHLVAVSGSNVGLVLGCAALIGARLPARLRRGLCAATLALYVVVVGPEPSVLRAALSALAVLAALGAGARPGGLEVLLVALTALLVVRPGLVGSAGLHLSVAATAGIVLWSRGIARRLRGLPRALAAALGVTLAAQLAVAPVLAATFGELSLVGPAANALAAPAVAPATVLGLGAAVAGLVWDPAGAALAGAAAPLAGWIAAVAGGAASLPGAAVEVPGWAGWVMGVPVAAGALAAARRA